MSSMACSARGSMMVVLLVLGVAGCQKLPGDADGGGEPSTSTAADTTGGTFLPGDTGGAEADEGGEIGCDPVAQTGCIDGEKCTVVTVGGTRDTYTCVADPEDLDPFAPCTSAPESGLDGCSAGHVCLEDDSDTGVCVPLCLKNADCEDALCVPDLVDDVPYCADQCSPFESLCASPLQCRRASDRFVCKFSGEADVGGQTDPCTMLDDGGCATGLVCVPGALVPDCATDNCCTSLCDLSGPDPCTSPATCSALFGAPAPGFEGIGACFVPA